jgi:hypothetical protein
MKYAFYLKGDCIVTRTNQYLLFDIERNLYCMGDGRFIKINECGHRSWPEDEVRTKLKSDTYPFGNGKWFFLRINGDGSKKLFQKDDEI